MFFFHIILFLGLNLPEWNLTPQKFYSNNMEDYEFVAPGSIIQSENYQLVLDVGEGVLQFDKQGVFQQKFFLIGQGPEEISSRTAFMTIDQNNRLLVADTFNGRIQLLDLNTNQYQTVKNQTMNFVVNAVPIEDQIWFGGYNSVFEMNSELELKKTILSSEFQSINMVGVSSGQGFFAISMLTYGDFNKLCMFSKDANGSINKKYLGFEKTKEIKAWSKKTKVPLLLTGMVQIKGDIFLSTKICNEEKTGLLFMLKKDTEILLPFYLKNIQSPVLFEGNPEKYLIDGYSSRIYQIE